MLTLEIDLELALGWLGAGRVRGTVRLPWVPAPGTLRVFATKELEDNMLTFKVLLPPAGAGDVVSRELTLIINGKLPMVESLPPEAGEYLGGAVDEDSSLELSLVDIDNAGNRSQPSTLSTVLRDTIAPPQPGELGVVVTGEIDDDQIDETVPDQEDEPSEETTAG